jgi:hypothetical protein
MDWIIHAIPATLLPLTFVNTHAVRMRTRVRGVGVVMFTRVKKL